MKSALIVWYLVMTPINTEPIVVPIQYVSKVDCEGAIPLFSKELQRKHKSVNSECIPVESKK